MSASPYVVSLSNFEGPLDLLLFFIKRDELDIYDIPIARITEEFLLYTQAIQALDLEQAGDFIVMAATLWLVRRPFLMSRERWLGLLGVLIGVDVALWIFAPAPAGGAVALLVLVIGAVLAHWWWLGRGSDPIIFISLFEGRSSLGRDVAATHIGAAYTGNTTWYTHWTCNSSYAQLGGDTDCTSLPTT